MRMLSHHLARRAMLAYIGLGWKTVSGGQTKTCHQSMKSLTVGFNRVGRCRLVGRGPRDAKKRVLVDIVGDMTDSLTDAASFELTQTRRLTPVDFGHGVLRQLIKYKLTKSLHNDCEQWWVNKAKRNENASVVGSVGQLFRLSREMVCKRPVFSEVISENNRP